jgi:excisionase family DNA binding protein
VSELLTARQVGAYLGFAPATIVDWYEAGKLPFGYKLGGRLRFRLSDLEAWLETKRAGAGGEAPAAPRQHPPEGVVSLTPAAPLQGGERA